MFQPGKEVAELGSCERSGEEERAGWMCLTQHKNRHPE